MFKSKNVIIILLSIFLSFSVSLYLNPTSNNYMLFPFILIIPFIMYSDVIINKLPLILKKYSKSKLISIFIFSAILSYLFYLSFLTYINYDLPFAFFINFICYLGISFLIYTSSLLFFVYILQYEIVPNINNNTNKKKILIYALPSIIIWCFFLIAFFPGVMTADSLNQWKQIVSGVLSDANPVIHTLLIFLITRIWYSPAAVAIFQIIILSLIWGYCMYRFDVMGVNSKILYLITLIFALNPANDIFSITLWKDILYSGFILLFTMNIINILVDKNWIKFRNNKCIFFISALGVNLFRHNGLLPFVVTMFLLIYIFRKESKFYLISFISICIIFVLIKGPFYKILNVHSASSSEVFGIPEQQIAAVIKENGNLTNDQKKYIEKIMPLENWAKNYMPGNVDYIKFDKSFNSDIIVNDKYNFIKTWIEICAQNPGITLEAYGDQTAIVWSVKGYTNWGSRIIAKNKFGLKQTVLSNTLTKFANKYLNLSQKNYVSQYVWRPALYMYFILLFGLVSILRNNKKSFIVLCPVLLNVLTILLATPAQDFRYLYPNTLVYLIIIIFSFIKIGENKNET